MVKLKAGNQVPADIRLLEVQELAANESALTGESLPVMKSCEVLKKGLPVAERKKYGIYVHGNQKGQRRGYCGCHRNGYRAWKNRRND